MRQLITTLIAFLTTCFTLSYGQTSLVFRDTFADRSQFIDLSTKLEWGADMASTSAFTFQRYHDGNVAYRAIKLTSDAFGYTDYSTTGSLKSSTAIDYVLPSPIDRPNDTILIDFDVRFSSLSLDGENGKLSFSLLHDYYELGPDFNAINDADPSTAPFGRPSYQLHIRNSNNNNGPILQYGGGNSQNGEWPIDNIGNFWLPGYGVETSMALPGSGLLFPEGPSLVNTDNLVSSTEWVHFSMVVYPEKIEVYSRKSFRPASWNNLILSMATPNDSNYTRILDEINMAHGVAISTIPPNYKYFPEFSALRFSWKGDATNALLANVQFQSKRFGDGGSTLPVSLSKFEATPAGKDLAQLSWTTLTEVNNSHFLIERADKTGEFQVVGQVSGNGNTTELKNYNFTDKLPMPNAGLYYYRLKQVDFDGTSAYYQTKSVQFDGNAVWDIYPNPFSNVIHVKSSADYVSRNSEWQIMDRDGRTAASGFFESDNTSIEIANQSLPSGVYWLAIKNGSEVNRQKIVKF